MYDDKNQLFPMRIPNRDRTGALDKLKTIRVARAFRPC